MRNYTALASSTLNLPQNSYIYTLTSTSPTSSPRSPNHAPLLPSCHLLALSSDNSLTIIDPSSLTPTSQLPTTHSSVTALKAYASPNEACSTFLTAGRDGVVLVWDTRTAAAVAQLAAPKREALSALAGAADLHTVVAGTELERDPPGDVSVLLWDLRRPGAPRARYDESHSDSVTELSFLPARHGGGDLLLSAGADGLVNVFASGIGEEDEAVRMVSSCESAVQKAGVLGGGEEVYALGTDERLSVFALAEEEEPEPGTGPCLLGDVRERFACEYVVDLYGAGGKTYLAAGSHSTGMLDLIRFKKRSGGEGQASSWTGKRESEKNIRLVGAHGEELVRDVYMPEGLEVVFTCGEDGMVRAWREEGDVEMGGMEAGERVGKKRKGERREGREKRRRD